MKIIQNDFHFHVTHLKLLPSKKVWDLRLINKIQWINHIKHTEKIKSFEVEEVLTIFGDFCPIQNQPRSLISQWHSKIKLVWSVKSHELLGQCLKTQTWFYVSCKLHDKKLLFLLWKTLSNFVFLIHFKVGWCFFELIFVKVEKLYCRNSTTQVVNLNWLQSFSNHNCL